MMRLDQLFAGIADAPPVEVSDLTSHSGLVREGGLFLACRGAGGHGLAFIDAAIAAGAAAVAWEPEAGLTEPDAAKYAAANVSVFAVPDLGSHAGELAARFFARPAEQLSIIGITGTNGKTTTAWLAAGALDRLAGDAAYMGTLGYGPIDRLQPTTLTTPGVIAVHRRLRDLADAGLRWVVMEVSSHALDQGRVDAVSIDTAAFSNLSRDHLDYHGTMAAYGEAKAKLFAHPGLEQAVINVGDAFGAALAERFAGRLPIVRVALADERGMAPDAELAATCSLTPAGLRLKFSGAYGEATLESPVWGRFNAENLLLAAGVLVTQGFELQAVVAALADGQLPAGRMQLVRAAAAPVVVIDFAHTPDALEKVLLTLREHCEGRIFCVFGCGGDRDSGKRAAMGEVAARLADHVILTSDNPRTEDPQSIVNDILAGIAADTAVQIELDRARAIVHAIDQAGARDSVLVAGKGSEQVQIIGTEQHPFSDLEVASRALGVAA